MQSILLRAYFHKNLTIAEIAKKIHVSIPSATAYINELIELKWLVEADALATASGRRPSIYNINPNKQYIVIVDVNTRTTTFYLLGLTNEVKYKKEISLPITSEGFVESVYKVLQEIKNEWGSPWVIGMSAPGLIDKKKETNLTYTNHLHEDMPLAEFLQLKLGIPTFLVNDTRASLLGEYHFGYVKKKENVVLLNLDWGVGMGILANGAIIDGSDGFAGEFGHIQVNPNGKLCHCGKIGCLDTEASASAILQAVNKGLKSGEQSLLSQKIEERDLALDDIIWAVNRGDSFAIHVVNHAANELGRGLAIVIHLLNPHTVIIDGILAQMGNLLTAAIHQAINKYCIYDFKKGLEIVVSPLGDLAKVYGASAYVFEKMVTD